MADPVEEYYRRFGGAPAAAPTSVTVPVPGAVANAKKRQMDIKNIESTIVDRVVSNNIAQQNADNSTRSENRQAAEDAREAAAEAEKIKNRKRYLASQIDTVLKNLDRADQKVSNWSTGFGHNLSYLPWSTEARSLDSYLGDGSPVASNIVLESMAELKNNSPTGATGFGNMTEREGDYLKNRLASLDLNKNPEEVRQTIQDIRNAYRRLQATLYDLDPDEPEVAKKFGIRPSKVTFNAEGKPEILSGNMKAVNPPEEMQREYAAQLLKVPRGELTVDKYREILNNVYSKFNFEYATGQNEEDYVKQYNTPNSRINIRIPGTEATPTFIEDKLSKGVQTAPGAFAAKAINAGGFGIGELLGGQKGRDMMTAIGDISPNASAVGDIFGSILGVSSLGAGMKAGGVMAGRPIAREFTGDMAYSAMREFNQSKEGDGISGALGGAAEAGLVNLLTRGVTRGLRKPGTSEQAIVDANKDLQLTPLQRAAMGDLEAGAGQSPITMGARKRASQSAVNKFIKGAYDDLGRVMPTDKTGRTLIADMHKAVNDEFASIADVPLGKVGNTGVNNITKLFSEYMPTNKFERDMMIQIRKRLSPLSIDGKLNARKEFTGQELRDVTESINATWKKLVKDKAPERAVETERMAEFVIKLKSTLMDQISDPSLRDRFSKLSNAYARKVVVDDAARGLTLGFPTPEDLLRAVERNTIGKANIAEGSGRFQKEVEDYISILGPSTHKLDPVNPHVGGYAGMTASALAALTHLPGVSQAISMPRKLGPINAEAIPIPALSQALQSYILRKKQEEGL